MIVSCRLNGKNYAASLLEPVDISIPLSLSDKNPNCYWAEHPAAETIIAGNFIGSVRQGGSVNYQRIHLTPHGNGTHTECYGHLSDDDRTLHQSLKQFHFIAELITVYPEKTSSGDSIITAANIISSIRFTKASALIIRTLPNDETKITRQYSGTNPPYLHPDATRWMAMQGIQHLLTDLPSIDRESDGGLLAAHKNFWQYPDNIRSGATITELIYVSPEVPDGLYLLNLQITSLEADASPSKPVIYKLKEVL